MAENRFRLKPVTDLAVEHGLYPNGSSAASTLISEDVPDDDTGYIYATGDEIVRGMEQQSSWKMGGDIPAEISKVTGVVAFLRGRGPSGKNIQIYDNHYLTLDIDGKTVEEVYIANFTADWTTYSVDITGAINIINEYTDRNKRFPNIKATLRSYMEGTSSANITSRYEFPITQFYLEVVYEENTNISRRI